MRKIAISVILVFSTSLLIFFQNCGETQTNSISAETNFDRLQYQTSSLTDPNQPIKFTNGKTDPNQFTTSTNVVVTRKNIEFSNTDDKVTIKGDFEYSTPFGPVRHKDVKVTGRAGEGKSKDQLVVKEFKGSVSLDLVNSPGIGELKPKRKVMTRANIRFANGKELQKFVKIPLIPKQEYVMYEITAGLFATILDLDIEIPVGAANSFLIVNPSTGLLYLEGNLLGGAGLLKPIQSVGIGFSKKSEIPYVPRSHFSFGDEFNFFKHPPKNFFDGFIKDSTVHKKSNQVSFDGNLFIQGKGSFKVKGVPISVAADGTFKLDIYNNLSKGTAGGYNGKAWIGLRVEKTDISIPLGKASVSAGNSKKEHFAYVSGEVEPGLTISPIGVDLKFGPDAKAAGFLHSDISKSFLRVRTNLAIGGLQLAGAILEMDQTGVSLGGVSNVGVAKAKLSGTIDNRGLILTGATSITTPFIGSKGILNTVTDLIKCGQKQVTNALACGEEYVTSAIKCGSHNYVRNALKCGQSFIKDPYCGKKTAENSAECGFKTITSIPKCGFTVATDFACIARCKPWESCNCDFKTGKSCKVAKTCEYVASCMVPKSCRPPKSCYTPKTCTVPKTCDIRIGTTPNFNFGTLKVSAALTFKAVSANLPDLAINGTAQLCDTVGANCSNISPGSISYKVTNPFQPQVCIDTGFLSIPGVQEVVEKALCFDF